MSFVMFAALAAVGLSPTVQVAARVLVLNIDAVGVDDAVARAIDPIVLQAAQMDGIAVLAADDIKKLQQLDAAKADLGCDTSSCLAELAGAIGAQWVLYGSASQLGTSTTVTLSLFDNVTHEVRREALTTTDLGTLPSGLPPKVRALLAVASPVAASAPVAAPADAGPSFVPIVGIGAIAVGGAAVLGGGVLAAINEVAIQDPKALGATKRAAQDNGVTGLIVVAVGVAIAAVGAGVLVVDGVLQ